MRHGNAKQSSYCHCVQIVHLLGDINIEQTKQPPTPNKCQKRFARIPQVSHAVYFKIAISSTKMMINTTMAVICLLSLALLATLFTAREARSNRL